jgi:hypothetical protein
VHVRPDSPALATDTERALAAIWQALLGAERIDRRDDFFALGGHSLLGIRLAARLWEVFEVDVPLKELLRSPGLAEMAELLERKLLDRLEAMTEVEAQERASRNDEEPR